jgi:hypothetical protein
VWERGQSGNPNGRRIKADDDWLPSETREERARRRSRERAAKWRRDNPDRVAALSKGSREKRKQRWDEFLAQERERYAKDAAAKLAQQKAARDSDPEKFRLRNHYRKYVAGVAHRRAIRLNATPPWVDRKAILAFYAEARRLTRETGIPHEVDHIHPLQGKNACGLHVRGIYR